MSEEVKVPEYVNDPNQVGNKTWRLTSGDGIEITKTTTDTVDTYKFDAAISEEEGNSLELLDDGLYAPVMSSRAIQLQEKLNELKEELKAIKELDLRATESITLERKTDKETGKDYVQARVNIAATEDNSIELRADGLYSQSLNLAPGSVADLERRLTLLEDELLVINQEIDNLKTSAILLSDGTVLPPVVIPDSANV